MTTNTTNDFDTRFGDRARALEEALSAAYPVTGVLAATLRGGEGAPLTGEWSHQGHWGEECCPGVWTDTFMDIIRCCNQLLEAWRQPPVHQDERWNQPYLSARVRAAVLTIREAAYEALDQFHDGFQESRVAELEALAAKAHAGRWPKTPSPRGSTCD